MENLELELLCKDHADWLPLHISALWSSQESATLLLQSCKRRIQSMNNQTILELKKQKTEYIRDHEILSNVKSSLSTSVAWFDCEILRYLRCTEFCSEVIIIERYLSFKLILFVILIYVYIVL
jgi:hypothetical protein